MPTGEHGSRLWATNLEQRLKTFTMGRHLTTLVTAGLV
jgi:hypothetical protein